MLKIGLTGGIASGKSTVAKILAELGAPVFDADKEAHFLLVKEGGAYQAIVEKFVYELKLDILNENAGIDRKKLGAIVFSDKELLQFLEKVMHRQIRLRCDVFIEKHEKEGAPAVILDIPLLIENFATGWKEKLDCVWLAYVPRDIQKIRLAQRDNISDEEIEKRLQLQMPIDKKRKYAGIVIDNSGSIGNTRKQIEVAWRNIILTGGNNV